MPRTGSTASDHELNFRYYVEAFKAIDAANKSRLWWRRYFLLLRFAGACLLIGGLIDAIRLVYANGSTQTFLSDVVAFVIGKFLFEQNDAKVKGADAVDPVAAHSVEPSTRDKTSSSSATDKEPTP
jgi:hypothetical protein